MSYDLLSQLIAFSVNIYIPSIGLSLNCGYNELFILLFLMSETRPTALSNYKHAHWKGIMYKCVHEWYCGVLCAIILL